MDSRLEQLESMSIDQLRTIAIERGFNEEDVVSATKTTLVESILEDEA